MLVVEMWPNRAAPGEEHLLILKQDGSLVCGYSSLLIVAVLIDADKASASTSLPFARSTTRVLKYILSEYVFEQLF